MRPTWQRRAEAWLGSATAWLSGARTGRRWGVALWLAACAAGAAGAEPASDDAVIATLVLNGQQVADAQVLHRADAGFWISERNARDWRVRTASRERRRFEGEEQVALCRGADRCRFDESSALLTLTLADADLVPLHIAATSVAAVTPEAVSTVGGTMNYDLNAWAGARKGIAAFADARVHSPWGHGVFRTAAVAQNRKAALALAQGLWQIDSAAGGWSLQAGSIHLPDTAFGGGVALTGVRLGSNARLLPPLALRTLPAVTGSADRLERTDVFVDGLFRQTAVVPYGPYRIETLPSRPGRGEIELVTTDLRGDEVRRSVPFYLSARALPEGASEWSLDLGRIAREPRTRWHGQPLLAGAAWRQGMGNGWTVASQALGAADFARVALGADRVDAQRGVSSAELVAQRSGGETRVWLGAGHEYQSRELSLTLRAERAADRCNGQPDPRESVLQLSRRCWRASATVGATPSPNWSAYVGWDAAREDGKRRAQLISANLRWNAAPHSELALSLQRAAVDGRRTSSLTVTWTQPIGRHVASAGMRTRSDGRHDAVWSMQNMPAADRSDDHRRWQAWGSTGTNDEAGALWQQRGESADWRADAMLRRQASSASVGVSGALGWAHGRTFASRRIDDAFVIVDAGLPDLPVLLDNRAVARTNAKGWAVVTEARARENNRIGVDIAALPVQYAMPRDQLNAVPALGAGALLVFDVSDGGTLLPVLDAAGQPLPAGARARVSTQRSVTAVTSASEVFVERSDRAARITVAWGDRRCAFDFDPAVSRPVYRCEPT